MGILKMRETMGHGAEKYIWYVLLLVFFASCFVGYGAYTGFRSGGRQEVADVAIVNGDPIPEDVFEKNYDKKLEEQKQQLNYSILMEDALRSDTLNQIIDLKLLVQEAKRQGIKIGNRDIDREINRQVDQAVAQQRGNQSQKEFEAMLRTNKMSLSDIENTVRSKYQDTNSREELRDSLYITQLGDKMKSKVTVSDAEVMWPFQTVSAHQIVIKGKGISQAQALKQAEQVTDMARKGQDFEGLARKYSQDATAAQGGKAPAYHYPIMEDELAKVVFGTKEGQISAPAKVGNDYYIIRVDKIESKVPKNFEKIRPQIRSAMESQKLQQVAGDLLKKLHDNAKIEKRDPMILAFDSFSKAMQQAGNKADRKANMEAFKKTIALYEKAAQKSNPGVAYARIGFIYMNGLAEGKPDYDKALLAYTKARNVASDPGIYMALAQLYMMKKDSKKAIEQYQAASDSAWGPNSLTLHQTLQKTFSKLGRTDLAGKEAKLVADLNTQIKQYQKQSPATAQPR